VRVWTALLLGLLISGAASAELRAGAAVADITPPVGSAMYGYGARGANVSEGVHDPLFAKALSVMRFPLAPWSATNSGVTTGSWSQVKFEPITARQ